MKLVCPGLRVALLLELLFYAFFVLVRLVCHMFQLHLAHNYWNSCPLEPRIPIWNLIDAIFGITFLVVEILEKFILLPNVLKKLQFRKIRVSISSVATVSTTIRGFCAVFLCLWFFTGNFWVFPLTDEVLRPANPTNVNSAHNVIPVETISKTQVYVIEEPFSDVTTSTEQLTWSLFNDFTSEIVADEESTIDDTLLGVWSLIESFKLLLKFKPVTDSSAFLNETEGSTESSVNEIASSTDPLSSTASWIVQNSTVPHPETEMCNKTLFLATFWILVGSYIVVGTIFSAAFLLACCAEPFQKVYRCLRDLSRHASQLFEATSFSSKRRDYELIS